MPGDSDGRQLGPLTRSERAKLQDALLAVRKRVEDELGNAHLELRPATVPAELQGLLAFAAQFGIGDDGVREKAIRMMPTEFVRAMAQEVRANEDAIASWADEGEFTLEKSAFVALMQSVLYFEYGPAAERVAPEKVKAFRHELEAALGNVSDTSVQRPR